MTAPTKPQPKPKPTPQPQPITSEPHPATGSPWRPTYTAVLPTVDPGAHALAHPRPLAGCPWCPPVTCPRCGPLCVDPAGCRRVLVAGETGLRDLAGAR